MKFDENNGSQAEQVDQNIVGDVMPSTAIRRMRIGEIWPIEENLLVGEEELCPTHVEPSPPLVDPQATQEQPQISQASEQDQGQDHSSGSHPPNDVQDQVQDHPSGSTPPNDVQGQDRDDAQASDDEGDDEAKSQETLEAMREIRKRRNEVDLIFKGNTIDKVLGNVRDGFTT